MATASVSQHEFSAAYVTVPSEEVAEKISKVLLESRVSFETMWGWIVCGGSAEMAAGLSTHISHAHRQQRV